MLVLGDVGVGVGLWWLVLALVGLVLGGVGVEGGVGWGGTSSLSAFEVVLGDMEILQLIVPQAHSQNMYIGGQGALNHGVRPPFSGEKASRIL